MPTDQDQAEQTKVEEAPGPTAKQMALVEEANAKRVVDQMRANELRAERENRPVENLLGLAAKGRDALLQGLRKHTQEAAPPPYVPPPMTDRQKMALREEMEAGAKAVAKAAAQRAHHPTLPPPKDNNEGLTNPVHRPGDFVPGLFSKDPAIK